MILIKYVFFPPKFRHVPLSIYYYTQLSGVYKSSILLEKKYLLKDNLALWLSCGIKEEISTEKSLFYEMKTEIMKVVKYDRITE